MVNEVTNEEALGVMLVNAGIGGGIILGTVLAIPAATVVMTLLGGINLLLLIHQLQKMK